MKNNWNEEKENIKVTANAKLIYYVLNQLTIPRSIREDCISEGYFALLKACRTFKKDNEVKFSTYAVKCIKNAMLQQINKYNAYHNIKFINLDKLCNDTDGSSLTEAISDNSCIFKEIDDDEIGEVYQKLNFKYKDLYTDFLLGYSKGELCDKYNLSYIQLQKIMKRCQCYLRAKLRRFKDESE